MASIASNEVQVMIIDSYKETKIITIGIRAVDPRIGGEHPFRREIAEFFFNLQKQKSEASEEKTQQVVNSLSRSDFLKFDGLHPRAWIVKCNRSFSLLENVPDKEKIILAAWNFVGRAATWYHDFSSKRIDITWQFFCELLLIRFEQYKEKQVADEFSKLKFTNNYAQYVEKFEVLKNSMQGVFGDSFDEEYYVDSFINGLCSKLKSTLELLKPTSLHEAMDLGEMHLKVMEADNKKLEDLIGQTVGKEGGLYLDCIHGINTSPECKQVINHTDVLEKFTYIKLAAEQGLHVEEVMIYKSAVELPFRAVNCNDGMATTRGFASDINPTKQVAETDSTMVFIKKGIGGVVPKECGAMKVKMEMRAPLDGLGVDDEMGVTQPPNDTSSYEQGRDDLFSEGISITTDILEKANILGEEIKSQALSIIEDDELNVKDKKTKQPRWFTKLSRLLDNPHYKEHKKVHESHKSHDCLELSSCKFFQLEMDDKLASARDIDQIAFEKVLISEERETLLRLAEGDKALKDLEDIHTNSQKGIPTRDAIYEQPLRSLQLICEPALFDQQYREEGCDKNFQTAEGTWWLKNKGGDYHIIHHGDFLVGLILAKIEFSLQFENDSAHKRAALGLLMDGKIKAQHKNLHHVCRYNRMHKMFIKQEIWGNQIFLHKMTVQTEIEEGTLDKDSISTGGALSLPLQSLHFIIEVKMQAADKLLQEKNRSRALLAKRSKKVQEDLLKQVVGWLINVEQQFADVGLGFGSKYQRSILNFNYYGLCYVPQDHILQLSFDEITRDNEEVYLNFRLYGHAIVFQWWNLEFAYFFYSIYQIQQNASIAKNFIPVSERVLAHKDFIFSGLPSSLVEIRGSNSTPQRRGDEYTSNLGRIVELELICWIDVILDLCLWGNVLSKAYLYYDPWGQGSKIGGGIVMRMDIEKEEEVGDELGSVEEECGVG